MKTQTFAEQKIALAQTILALSDTKKIDQIQNYINHLLQNKLESEEDYDAKFMSFAEWNQQFSDQQNMDDYINEYGMSVRDFRQSIYESEKEKGMSKQAFLKKMNALK